MPSSIAPQPRDVRDGRARVLAARGVLAAGLAALVFGLVRNREFAHDDAYITLRYARNLLAGEGLVWNPGEPVEGYTSLLATLLIALLGRLGLDLFVAARALNLVAALALGLVVRSTCLREQARRGGCDPLAAAVPAALVWATQPLAAWVCGGLEAPLFALVVCVAAGQLLPLLAGERSPRRAALAGLAFALAVLTRPDGGVFAALAGLFLLAHAHRSGREGWRVVALFAGTAAAVLLPHLLWRHATYDAWLPNPVHAKALGLPGPSWQRGSDYVGPFVIHAPHWPVLALLGALAGWRARVQRSGLAFLGTSVVVYGVLLARGGGDHMPAQRVLLPLVPLCALALGAGLDRWPTRGAPWMLAGLGGLVLVQFRQQPPLEEDPAARMGKMMAAHIAGRWPAGTLVALNTAGSTPYFAPDYRYLDMLGLNDRHIARRRIERYELPQQRIPGHGKGDGRYVLDRAPDVIVIGPAQGTRASRALFLSGHELAGLPGFQAAYELVIEPVGGREPYRVAYYRRKGNPIFDRDGGSAEMDGGTR